MRTPQELQKLLQRLYNAKAQAEEQVVEADAAACGCPNCERYRVALIGVTLQIDVVLYTLGAESTTSAFMAAADLRDERKQANLEEKYADFDNAQIAQENLTNARVN